VRAFFVLLLVALLVGCGSHGTTKPSASAGASPTALHSLPGLEPPHLVVTHPAVDVSPGYVFIAQKGGKAKKGGPVIADNRGRIIWYHQLAAPLQATDFRVQTYRGKPVLTWWEGRISKAGIGRGKYVVYDTSYRQIASVEAGNDLDGDLHEFQLTPRGTAYLTAYEEVPADLASVGGPKHGYAYDSIVQEVDIKTGRVVFEWHSIGHVPFSESTQAHREPAKDATKKRPLDYFHVNSIADAPDDDILISGRNTSTIYELDRDGQIVWRLGGKQSDFGPPAAVKFSFQHNARLHPGNVLTLFDNGATPKVEPFTRPLVLKLDVARKRVTIVKSFVHPQHLLSPFEGNLQLLPDGGAFIGWGGVRRVSEFAPDGTLRFELKLPFGDTYRGFRFVWHGRPPGRPAVARVGDRVYASWNGQGAIARWTVLAGPDAAHLARVTSYAWDGLETAIQLQSHPKAVAVEAVDAAGHAIGRSLTLGG
jgi:hypothetical protein